MNAGTLFQSFPSSSLHEPSSDSIPDLSSPTKASHRVDVAVSGVAGAVPDAQVNAVVYLALMEAILAIGSTDQAVACAANRYLDGVARRGRRGARLAAGRLSWLSACWSPSSLLVPEELLILAVEEDTRLNLMQPARETPRSWSTAASGELTLAEQWRHMVHRDR